MTGNDGQLKDSESAAEKGSASAEKLSTRSAAVVSLAVLCSRFLGLAREQIFLNLFGAGFAMDAFVAAFRIPNLLRDLFAEGALSTAFVTTFSRKIQTEGEDAAWALARRVATLAVVSLSLVTILGILAAPVLVEALGWGFTAEKKELTIELTRVMFPFILLVSLAALAMGMLNSRNVFGMPAMASSFFNLGSIVAGVAAGWWLDPGFGTRAILGMAVGTLVGGTLQLLVQLPALRRVGFRFRPDFTWRDEGVKTVLRLMGPAVVAASAVQVNVMINSSFASHLGDGPMSWLNCAFRLMQLPLGLFGVAIGTVTLPLVSRSAAGGNWAEFRAVLGRGLRLACLLTVPATVGLIVLARPVIGLIYEHGKFNALSTAEAAAALQCYALGLVAYSAIKILAPAFYAMDRRRTPMLVSFGAIGVNLVLNWLFAFRLGMGHRGLALSTGCVAIFNCAVLYLLMRRYLGGLHGVFFAKTLGRIAVACIPMAAVCLGAQASFFSNWTGMSFTGRLTALGSTILLAVLVFFGCAVLLRVDGLDQIVGLIRRRFGSLTGRRGR